MAPRTLYIIAFVFIASLQLVAAWWPVVASIGNIISTGLVLAFLYLLDKKSNEDWKKQREALAETGTAITDTLKVAFENLKKVSGTATKIQGKLTDHDSRLHRLEQIQQRTAGAEARREAIKWAEAGRESPPPMPRRTSPLMPVPKKPAPSGGTENKTEK